MKNNITMTQTSLKCGCSINLIVHIINLIFLLLVLVIQGSMINFCLILHNEGTAGWYFWFLADFLVLIGFMASGIISYKFYKRKARLQQEGHPEDVVDSMLTPSTRFGILPLCYMVWLFYALLLTTKIILLFKMNIAQTLDSTVTFSPQMLKVVIALSIIVFMLLVVIHNNAKRHSHHYNYFNDLIGSTSFEILDSVTFLSILFVNETKLILPYSLENAILILSCVNFLLPTLALYMLSQSKFGIHLSSPNLTFLYNFLHLALINLPYFAIRVHLWTNFDRDVSLFLLKNVLLILIRSQNIVSGFQYWLKLWKERKHKYKHPTESNLELGIISRQSEHSEESTMIHMDEINLNTKFANKSHL
ncbi:transmembrane protein 121B-like [Centruroides vittatus]|uniref:transmembrane protein 121B-like n=1 Tax=Centruroides vittatus TaxID=120091 RepID=UPI00350EE1BB